MNTNPVVDMYALAFFGALFMGGVCWCVYKVLKMAHDEEPGCLDPRH